MTAPLLDPLDEARIRHAHREILETVRGLAAEVAADPVRDLGAWLAAARAAVAFLRQGVPPVARWEEACYRPASPTAEDTGFEHAFLHAEVDAFAAAVASVSALPAAPARARARECVAEVRRRLARIEAVLELHVLKAEDRSATLAAHPPAREPPPRGGPAPPDASVPPAPPRAEPEPFEAGVGLRTMSAAEIDALLGRNGWGMLGTLGEAGPYVVPVAYGYDGDALFLACAAGRKLANLLHDPRVCLTVAEVADGERWRCVVVEGEAVSVDGAPERAEALRGIRLQRSEAGQTAPGDYRRGAGARVFRVAGPRVSGRARGADRPVAETAS